MTALLARRRGALAGGGGEFDPLTDITWHSVYSADKITAVNGDPIGTWADQSGNAHDLTQATASFRPLYRSAEASVNGQPTLEFDGVDDYLRSSFTALTQPNTIVAVVRRRVSGGTKVVWDGAASGARHYLLTVADKWSIGSPTQQEASVFTASTAAHYYAATYDGAAVASKLRLDGTNNPNNVNTGTESLTGLTLGANITPGAFISVHVPFLGVYDGVMSTADIDAIRSWAQTKYGTP